MVRTAAISAAVVAAFVALVFSVVACGTEGEPAANPTPPASAEPVSPTASLPEAALTPAGPPATHSSTTPEPTPSATPAPSPTTAVSTTPSETQTAQVGLVFFLRPPEEPWTPDTDYWEQLGRGDLWMANADGSGEQQITRGKANVTFAGLLTTEDGPTLYYTSGDGTTSDLWRRVLRTGAETRLLSFNAWPYWRGGDPVWATLAAVSPDGQYAALVEARDIVLADLATGERRTLFKSNHPECEETDIVHCFSYSRPHWSPDGSLLAVGRSQWEAWGEFIVDPFEQLSVYEPSDLPRIQGRLDWRTSNEACTTAVWLGPGGGLYLIDGPDWTFDPNEAEDITGYVPTPGEGCADVQKCAWLDEKRIALSVSSCPSLSRIEVIDVDTREITPLAEFTDEGTATQIIDMSVLRAEGLIVYNRLHYIQHADMLHHEEFTTAGLIRVADRSHQPILRERDHVIALVPGLAGE